MSQEDEAPRHAPVQDLSAEPPPPLAPPAGSRPASPPPEARQPLSAAELEEECRLLELENACLLQLLQRVAPDSLRLGHEASADGPAPADGPGPEPLLLAEKQELCAAEAAAVRQAIERTQQEGELEAACAAAALTDCQVQQAGEVLRDATALLTLLGLPVEPEPAAASGSIPEQPAGADGEPGQQEGQAPAAPAGPAPSPLGLRLPTAKQLARAQLNGAQLEGLLEGMLERQDAAAERLRLRGAMLKVRCRQRRRL